MKIALWEPQELMENTSRVKQSSEFELFQVVKSNEDKIRWYRKLFQLIIASKVRDTSLVLILLFSFFIN